MGKKGSDGRKGGRRGGNKSKGKGAEGGCAQGYAPNLPPEAMQYHQMQMFQQMQMYPMQGWPADASMMEQMPGTLSDQVLPAPGDSKGSAVAETASPEPASAESTAAGGSPHTADTAATSDASADIGEHVDVDPWRRYEEVKELGQGRAGAVKLARDRECEGRLVAIKRAVTARSEYSDSQIQRELNIMKKLSHEHICRLFDTYLHGRHRYFIMEYLEGGELLDEIMAEGPMNEEKAREIFRQVAGAMHYAHANGIAHRDLRPENICFATEHRRFVKVIDWGHATFLSTMKRMSTPDVGTFLYKAPEVQEAQGGQTYTNACDLWSLGALLYVMLSGKMPTWVFGSHADTLQAKKAEQFPMDGPEWTAISEEAKVLIKSLLKADPEQRLPTKEVLLHPWMTKLL